MSITFRRTFRLARWLFVIVTGRGVSASARVGRVSVSSRGRASVRLGKGFSWRIR